MSFVEYLHGHAPFGVAMVLLIFVLGFFIFMAARMFKKSKNKSTSRAKKYGIFFSLGAAVVVLIMIASVAVHYHFSLKI